MSAWFAVSVERGRARTEERVFRRNTSTPRSGLAGKRSVRGRREGTHQVDGGHGPVEIGVAVAQGRRRGAPRVLVLVQQPGDVIRAGGRGEGSGKSARRSATETRRSRRREGRLALYARARKRERSAAIGAPTRTLVGRRTRLDSSRRRSTRARVEKSCGGLKSGAGTEKPSARRCGDRVPPRRRRRELIAPRGTRLGLTSPEHFQGPFPGPPPPSAFAGLHGRASHNAWRTKKRTCLIELSRPEVFGGEVRFVCTTLARTNIESIIQSGIKGKSRNVCAAVLKRSIAVRRRRRRSARRVQKLPRARWGRSAPMTG